MKGPLKCKDYDATVDITQKWPLIGIGSPNRKASIWYSVSVTRRKMD